MTVAGCTERVPGVAQDTTRMPQSAAMNAACIAASSLRRHAATRGDDGRAMLLQCIVSKSPRQRRTSAPEGHGLSLILLRGNAAGQHDIPVDAAQRAGNFLQTN
ncbi:MAG TPA: hypothetical protein VFV55_00610 [Usitatibacteraceae bacterium]|nr:hypothetical protein [Usitatibacteraceae bacterium]